MNELNYPNPWDFPNKNVNDLNEEFKFIFMFSNLNEIGMGAPLSGTCKLSINGFKNIKIGNNCGGPIISNSTGDKVAIPIWEKSFFNGTFQRIGL